MSNHHKWVGFVGGALRQATGVWYLKGEALSAKKAVPQERHSVVPQEQTEKLRDDKRQRTIRAYSYQARGFKTLAYQKRSIKPYLANWVR